MALLVKTQFGLGDCIYHRPFIKQLARRENLYVETPWPELYIDLPVRFVRPRTTLRTQNKNITRQKIYEPVPPGAAHCRPSYIGGNCMVDDLAKAYNLPVTEMDLPDYPAPAIDKPYLVVRPATVRKEWSAPGRNPNPQYLYDFVQSARQLYTIVSIADLQDGEEYALDPLPPADIVYHEGELDATQLLGLLQHASLIVGGVGFIVPAAIAFGTPLVCILGGTGGYNAPSKILHPKMRSDNITFIKPDRYCMCTNYEHNCDKTISNFNRVTEAYFANL